MTMKDNGGPAFPTEPNTQPGVYVHHGMTLRDYFAGQALVSIADDCGMSDAETAERCYQRADAMLAERSK